MLGLVAAPSGEKLRLAGAADREGLLALAEAFHQEDGHPLPEAGKRALTLLLDAPEHGNVFLIEAAGARVGYAVLCFSFSIEWGGKDAFLDDLYLVPECRSKGLGAWILRQLEAAARAAGCRAMHLEVMGQNPAARLYRRAGFQDRGSLLMSKPLIEP